MRGRRKSRWTRCQVSSQGSRRFRVSQKPIRRRVKTPWSLCDIPGSFLWRCYVLSFSPLSIDVCFPPVLFVFNSLFLPLPRQRHAIENETKKQWFPRNIAVFARNIAPVDIVLRALRKVWRFVAGFMIVLMRPLAEYMRPCGWGTKCISLKK